MLSDYDTKLVVAGTDEAGRGCLAGPVTAAAVILPPHFKHPLLNDSKQLNKKQRALLAPIIKQEALAYAVAHISHMVIDEINILNASIMAMHKCIETLTIRPEFIIVDGNRFKPYLDIPYRTIIKGDEIYSSIAAASILAKTERDLFMETLHEEYPQYSWNQNKGYPTKKHRLGIVSYGLSPYHRKTFRLLNPMQSLGF
jgi:ribonuclease HII